MVLPTAGSLGDEGADIVGKSHQECTTNNPVKAKTPGSPGVFYGGTGGI
jgi:hypothetical protein